MITRGLILIAIAFIWCEPVSAGYISTISASGPNDFDSARGNNFSADVARLTIPRRFEGRVRLNFTTTLFDDDFDSRTDLEDEIALKFLDFGGLTADASQEYLISLQWDWPGPAPGARVDLRAGIDMRAEARSDISIGGLGTERVVSEALGRGNVTVFSPAGVQSQQDAVGVKIDLTDGDATLQVGASVSEKGAGVELGAAKTLTSRPTLMDFDTAKPTVSDQFMIGDSAQIRINYDWLVFASLLASEGTSGNAEATVKPFFELHLTPKGLEHGGALSITRPIPEPPSLALFLGGLITAGLGLRFVQNRSPRKRCSDHTSVTPMA